MYSKRQNIKVHIYEVSVRFQIMSQVMETETKCKFGTDYHEEKQKLDALSVSLIPSATKHPV